MSAPVDREIICAINDGEIAGEMLYRSFLDGDSFASSADEDGDQFVYCVLGNGLALQAIVFFRHDAAEEAGFTVPFAQLAQQAGTQVTPAGGEVRCVSKARCPVPWHAGKLWDPEDFSIIDDVARRLRENTLGIPPQVHGETDDFFSLGDFLDEPHMAPQSAFKDFGSIGEEVSDELRSFNDVADELTNAADGGVSLAEVIRRQAVQLDLARQEFEDSLVERHNAYQSEIRSAREQIMELRLALEKERARSLKLRKALKQKS